MKQQILFVVAAFFAALAMVSCLWGDGDSGSNSVAEPQSSFCAFPESHICVAGSFSECQSGGVLMSSCPLGYELIGGSQGGSGPSVSDGRQYFFCVYPVSDMCVAGLVTSCSAGGILMDDCPEGFSRSNGNGVLPSSGSGAREYAYCVFVGLEKCFDGPYASCADGGMLSNSCPWVAGSSSSGGGGVVPPNNGGGNLPEFNFCVYNSLKDCMTGPGGKVTSCPGSGYLSNTCPEFDPDPGFTPQYIAHCDFADLKICLDGPVTECPVGGEPVDVCTDYNPPEPTFGDCEDSFNEFADRAAFEAREYYCSDGVKKKYGKIEDSRDGKIYKTVTIGSQTWMAENLNWIAKNEDSDCLGFNRCYTVSPNANSCSETNSTLEFCNIYGRHYNWFAVVNVTDCNPSGYCNITIPNYRGICPEGWHVPSEGDYYLLMLTVKTAANFKAIGKWKDTYEQTDKFGFSALPGNQMSSTLGNDNVNKDDPSTSDRAYFWTSTEVNTSNGRALHIYSDNTIGFGSNGMNAKSLSNSLRCIKN